MFGDLGTSFEVEGVSGIRFGDGGISLSPSESRVTVRILLAAEADEILGGMWLSRGGGGVDSLFTLPHESSAK